MEFSYIPGGQPTYSGSRTYYACSCKEGYSNSAGTGEVVTESETIQCIVASDTPDTSDTCPPGTTEDESGVCVPDCAYNNENVEYTYDNIQGYLCSCKEGYSNSAGTGEFVTETETIKCCLLYLGVCVSNCPPGTTADEAGICVSDCPPGTQYEAGVCVPDCAYNNENVEYTYDNIQGYLCSCKEGYSNSAGTGEFVTETETIKCCLLYLGVCVSNCPPGTTADEAGICVSDCPPGTQYEAGVCVPDCAYNNENVEYTYDNIQGYLCSCKPGTKRIEGTPSETTSIQCVYNCPSGKIEAVTQSETLCISTPDCAAMENPNVYVVMEPDPVCYCEPGTKRLDGTPSDIFRIQCVDNCPSGTTQVNTGVCVPNCAVDNENVEYTYNNILLSTKTHYECSCKKDIQIVQVQVKLSPKARPYNVFSNKKE